MRVASFFPPCYEHVAVFYSRLNVTRVQKDIGMQKTNRKGASSHFRSKVPRIAKDVKLALREQADPVGHPDCWLYTMESSTKAQVILYAQFALSRVKADAAKEKITRVIATLTDLEDLESDTKKRQLQYVLECIQHLGDRWYASVVDLVTAQLLCRYLVLPIADARGNTVHSLIQAELK